MQLAFHHKAMISSVHNTSFPPGYATKENRHRNGPSWHSQVMQKRPCEAFREDERHRV